MLFRLLLIALIPAVLCAQDPFLEPEAGNSYEPLDLGETRVELTPADTSLEALSQLPGLNDFQRYYLWKQVRRSGWPVSVYELQQVFGDDHGLAESTFRLLPRPGKTPYRRGQSILRLRLGRQAEPVRGVQEGKYAGPPEAGWFHLRLLRQHWDTHLTLERDAGERRLVDFQSFSFQFMARNQSFLAGDYRLRLGQGLLFWNGYAPMDPFSTLRSSPTVSPAAGRDETRFQRGLSWRYGKGSKTLVLGGSHRYFSASLEEGGFKTLRMDGLHRTETEQRYRFNLGTTTFFVSAEHRGGWADWSIYALHHRFTSVYGATGSRELPQLGGCYRLLLNGLFGFGEVGWSNGLVQEHGLNWFFSDWGAFLSWSSAGHGYASPFASTRPLSNELWRLGLVRDGGSWKLRSVLDLGTAGKWRFTAERNLSGLLLELGAVHDFPLGYLPVPGSWRWMAAFNHSSGRFTHKLQLQGSEPANWLLAWRVGYRSSSGRWKLRLGWQQAGLLPDAAPLFAYMDGLPGDFLLQSHYESGQVINAQAILKISPYWECGIRLQREWRPEREELGSGLDASVGNSRHRLSLHLEVRY